MNLYKNLFYFFVSNGFYSSKSKNNIIDSKKFQFISGIKITTEYEIKKNNYKEGKYELSDYFKFKSDSKIYEIDKKLEIRILFV